MSAEPKRDLAERIHAEADIASRAGQSDRLRVLAAEVRGYVSPEEATVREAAARREALLEAAPKCDCAALLIETNSHEEHCATYRDPERERDEAVAALRRVVALADVFRDGGCTSVFESSIEIAELIDRALAEPERDEEGGR